MSPNDIVLKVIDALSHTGIPYMVVGSFSSNVHGIERNTVDVDLVMQLEQQAVGGLIRALGPDFRFDPQLGFETITMTYRYVASHLNPLFKIEFFILSDDAHDRERFNRRLMATIGSRAVYVASPEDVVITKLRWSKEGRRTKDIDDARGVLAVQKGKLDMPYVRRWSVEHGTLELLDKLLGSINAVPDAT